MSPRIGNFINKLKSSNLLKSARKAEVVTSPISRNSGEIIQACYAPVLAVASSAVALNLISRKINDDETALREVYNIDQKVFAETDPYENYEDFKSIIQERNLSTYSITDENGNLMGYYQLEPIKDDNLYIDSIALKEEFRKTKKGYQAINYAWSEILKYANENSVRTLSLHVNKEDKGLLNLYTKLGFVVKETIPAYYENGADALYMELNIPQANETDEYTETSLVQENTENMITEEPVLSEKDIAENEYYEKCKPIQDKMKTYHYSDYHISEILASLSYLDKDGTPIFSENLYEAFNKLSEQENSINVYNIAKIIEIISEEDENGVPHVEDKILSKLLRIQQEEKHLDNKINRICEIYKKANVLEKGLDLILSLNNISSFYKEDLILNCINPDNTFNADLAWFYTACNSYKYDVYDIKELEKGLTEVKDGKKVIKNATVIANILEKINTKNNNNIYSAYSISSIADAGCDIEDYLKYSNIVYTILQEDKDLRFEIDIPNEAAIAICTVKRPIRRFDNKIEYEKYFDSRMLDIFKKYYPILASNPDNYTEKKHEKLALCHLIKACMVQNDDYRGEVFDEKLMEKAIKLSEYNIPLLKTTEKSCIPIIAEILNACKKIRYDYWEEGKYSVVLDEAILQKVEEKLSQDYSANTVLEAVLFCKETNPDPYKKGEEFNQEAFDLYFELRKKYYHNGFQANVFKSSTGYPQINIQALRDACNKIGINVCLDSFFTYKNNTESVKKDYYFDYQKLKIYEELNNIVKSQAEDPNNAYFDGEKLKYLTKNGYDINSEIDYNKYLIVRDLLKNGFDEPKLSLFYEMKIEAMRLFQKLYKENMDIDIAYTIAKNCVEPDGSINQKKYEMSLELYQIGPEKEATSWSYCYDTTREGIGLLDAKKEFNEIAYDRLKKLIDKNLPSILIYNCREKGVYKDRLYKLLINLYEQGFSSNNLLYLMDICFNENENFDQKIYDMILDLKANSVDEDKIAAILKACKNNDKTFSEAAYKKALELKHQEMEEQGIEVFINACKKDGKFSQERAEEIKKLTANYKRLKDAFNNTDKQVIESLLQNEKSILKATEYFGEDIFNYAISLKATGYTTLAKNSSYLINHCSEAFVKELQERISLLPNPEIKVRRLMSLGSLASNVSENTLVPLMKMIESTKMSEEQKDIINKIFTDDSLDYETQIQMFVQQLDVPNKNKNYVIDYLKKVRLDKQIQRPGTIEEQMEQMDKYAQQMLTNAKIPLDKKIKYIDEFKAKKADMQANPEKYTTPKIFPKVMSELQKVVEAYINIPNSDTKFNNSIYETMYRNANIQSNTSLLEKIRYDAKYFDKLLTTTNDFKINFKRLIELVKMHPDKKLSEMRMIMPKENSPEYNKYLELRLIEQIQANLETKRQFEEANLDFEKWNTFDKELCGETFNVEIDPVIEYNNLKNNIVNEIQGDLIKKIKPEELEKFVENLNKNGFIIINNKIIYQGEELSRSSIEKLLKTILEYTNKNEYWQSALNNSGEITAEERDGATGFIDHIKGLQTKFNEIQNGRNVSNIYLRLSDPDNIGRNLFFGNHVGCCNSVESNYAGYSAPMHLMNAYVRGIEIVDDYGNSFGNSLCYFANIDGKICFVIDSFEANGKLASNPIVTEKIVEFAKQVTKAINSEELAVVFGPRYNHLDLSKFKVEGVGEFKVIGSASERTYCDTIGGKVLPDNINTPQGNIVIHRQL